jgi:hypothetical protein
MSVDDRIALAQRREKAAAALAIRLNGRLQCAIGAVEAGLKAVRAGQVSGADALLDVLAELTRRDVT